MRFMPSAMRAARRPRAQLMSTVLARRQRHLRFDLPHSVAMPQETKVDTTRFNEMCRMLARHSAAPYAEVVRAEVGRVLERSLQLTPVAKAQSMIDKWATAIFSAQPESLYTPQTREGLAVRARARRQNGKLLYFLFNRYPDALYSGIQNRRLDSLKKRIAAIGLAKQSWLRIAQLLGLTIKAPGWVDRASAYGREHPENFQVRQKVSTSEVVIGFTNSQPTVNIPQVGGTRALAAAIAGRVKYFETNIAKHVFADVARIAKRYPGITVRATNFSAN